MMEGLIEKWIAVTVIVAVICVIRSLARGRIRPGVIYGLWGLVVLRLLWPAAAALPESRYSIQNLQVSQKITAEYEQVQEEWFQNEKIPEIEREPEQIFSGNGKHPAQDNVSTGTQNVIPSVGQNVNQNAGQNVEQNIGQDIGQNTEQNTGSQSTGVQNWEIQNANRGESSQSGMMSSSLWQIPCSRVR